MSLATIHLTGGVVFGATTLIFGAGAVFNMAMNGKGYRDACYVRGKLLTKAFLLSLIYAFAYFLAFGGYGLGGAPPQNQGLILTWPFAWYLVGKALATYLWHADYWRHYASTALALAGVAHYIGTFVTAATPGIQWVAWAAGLLATLSVVYVVLAFKRRCDTNSSIAIGIALVALVGGHYLAYLLGPAHLNQLNIGETAYWLLVADIVLYVGLAVFMVLTGLDMKASSKHGKD